MAMVACAAALGVFALVQQVTLPFDTPATAVIVYPPAVYRRRADFDTYPVSTGKYTGHFRSRADINTAYDDRPASTCTGNGNSTGDIHAAHDYRNSDG
jgi:hypothetical protein